MADFSIGVFFLTSQNVTRVNVPIKIKGMRRNEARLRPSLIFLGLIGICEGSKYAPEKAILRSDFALSKSNHRVRERHHHRQSVK